MTGVVGGARDHPALAAGVMTAVAYGLVVGTFLGLVPLYPSLEEATSTVLSHAVAVVNAMTIVALVIGWTAIRRGRVRRHRRAMIAAFGLILLFLVLYLTRVGGGGTKYFVGPDVVTGAYRLMLGVHIALSVIAVPLVLYALILGLTRTPTALARTHHATVGQVAVASWLLSLILGLVTYVMLEHLYGGDYVAAVGPVLL